MTGLDQLALNTNISDVLVIISQLFRNTWFIIAFVLSLIILPMIPIFFREMISDYKIDRDYYKKRGINFWGHARRHYKAYAKDAAIIRFRGY